LRDGRRDADARRENRIARLKENGADNEGALTASTPGNASGVMPAVRQRFGVSNLAKTWASLLSRISEVRPAIVASLRPPGMPESGSGSIFE
jgi:hypothetical protein